MAINIKFDTAGNPEPPSIILATKNGNKLGLLNVNADSIELNGKLKVSEISFTLNKYIDGKLNNLWDKVVDFKLVWCKEWDCWFEIKVEIDEATETIKTVFGTQLGQAELSQIMVYNMEVNTEEDIARDDYKITILYDEDDHDASLLHRILKDKAPHYSIAYVDPTIARIQRQFSWDGSSICDVLDEVEEEIGCVVVYNSNSTEGGIPNRSISVYDLEQNCNDCGYRGEFTDECPKCGSKNIKYGYGEDTTIFVTNDELATEGIQLVADIDSVKNCFKLEAGDDLMTATIRNCNPNGSDYIWRFSNDIKEDMSDELVKKLESYDAEYKRYCNEHKSDLDATLLEQYNNLVEKYDDFYNTDSTCLNCDNKGKFYDKCPSCDSENLLTGKELQKISTPIVGYPSLMNAYYNTIDFALYLESGLMPSVAISDTTAEEQASLLTTYSLSPVAVNVKEVSSISLTTADSAVLSIAKVIVKPTYKVEVLSSSLSSEKKWSGTFKITNYSDDIDTFEVVVNDIEVNNNAETFIKQKIEKALNKENTDDYSISGLFEKEYDEFCTELTKYALNPLQSFYDAADVCINILTEQGAGDETNKPDLYENLYLPYFQKQEAIANEINIRKNELAIIEGVYDETTKTTSGGLQNNIRNCQSVIQDALNFEDYLGEDLWKEFCSFRREDKYSNSNYISDGLNNAQLFERALEFLDVVENEIYKSSELQHSISTSLNNLLAIDKFKPLVKYFKNGNWIRVRVDDKIYKLRLLEYNIDFGSFESIPVEFSDVTKIKNGVTDVKDVLEQASYVASSYDAVTRQAKKGNVAKSTIEQWIDEGLNAANVQIQSNDNEEILITKNGLLGRSYDDITGAYSPEQVKLTHNIMAYTDDNWQTVKQAIGKHKYSAYDEELGEIVDNKIGYGMSAEFVTAGVVSGSQIIGGDVYSDNYSITGRTGSYLNLRDGTFSFGGGALRFEGGELLISSPNVVTKNEVTTINEEYLKTTSVYAQNLKVNAAHIQDKLTATQIDTQGLIAENISSTTINGKTITGGSILIGDTTKVGDYAEIANDGTLTCTNVDIQGGTLQMGSKENEETHTWITSDGTLNTYNANISGEIRASSGSIGGFTIETTETNEDGVKSGGWLYSGESIGSDKSIFLSATNMSGTMPFMANVARMDENGEIEIDENGETIFDTVEHSLTKEDWRITVGSNFGITEDGTTYMSNSEIVGGSLKIGDENSDYHTWISSDGVMNAKGVNINGKITAVEGVIAGWDITKDGIEKNGVVGMSSGDDSYISLIDANIQSPIRFYAGGVENQDEVSESTQTKTLAFTSTGKTLTQTITLSEQEQKIYKVVDAKSLTTIKLHSGSVSNQQVSVTMGDTAMNTPDGKHIYTGRAIYSLLPVWVLKEHITTMYSTNDRVSLTYLGNGKVAVSATYETANFTIFDTVTIEYSFTEILDINIIYNDTTVNVAFYPQTVDVKYDIDIEYILNVKNANFMVLENGSLYANAAQIKGHIEATSGSFTGEIKAETGNIGDLNISINGISSNDGKLSFNSNGSIVTKIFEAENIKTASISGRTVNAPSLTFETSSNEKEDVAVEIEYDIVEKGETNLTDITKIGEVKLTISTDKILTAAKKFTVWVSYYNNVWDKTSSISVDMIVLSGENMATATVPHMQWFKAIGGIQARYTFSSISLYPRTFEQISTTATSNITSSANFVPTTNTLTLGSSTMPWQSIYSQNLLTQTTTWGSDRKLKDNILAINDDFSEQLIKGLLPKSYVFKTEQMKTHYGFIAQEVEELLNSLDVNANEVGIVCKSLPDESNGANNFYSLNYMDLIAPMVSVIQRLLKRVEYLESKD